MSTQPGKLALECNRYRFYHLELLYSKHLLLILTPLIKSWAKVFDRKLSQTVLLFSPSFLSQPHISRVLHKTTLVQLRLSMSANYLYFTGTKKYIVE